MVLATFMLVTAAKKKAVENAQIIKTGENGAYLGTKLIQILYIQYPITYWKKSILALFDLSNEVNTIYSIFTKELAFYIRSTDIGV